MRPGSRRAFVGHRLARLDALREIRAVLTPLGDLQAELTLTARYILAELDRESELLRILASEGRNRPQLLRTAVEQLVNSTFTGFAAWIVKRAERPISVGKADAVAALGLGSLFCSRLLPSVLGLPFRADDEVLVDTWVEMMTLTLSNPKPE